LGITGRTEAGAYRTFPAGAKGSSRHRDDGLILEQPMAERQRVVDARELEEQE
jgi:hypothetical protein